MERCNKPATHFSNYNGYRVCAECLALEKEKDRFEPIDVEGKCDRPLYFAVPESNYATLEERIAKLNKRAAKLQCNPIALSVIGEHEVPVYEKDFDGHTKFVDGKPVVKSWRKVLHVLAFGEAPKLNGWEFIATIEPTYNDQGAVIGNVLRNVPNASKPVPVRYREASSWCEHCNTSRRRNQTFIVYCAENDVYKQVGRNCLRDFCGHTDPDRYCSMAEWLREAYDLIGGSEEEGFFGAGVRNVERFDAYDVLALTACEVRLEGWRSNKTAREYGTTSTSSIVINWIYETQKSKWKEFQLIPNDVDKATAIEVVAWLATLKDRADLNDYMYNLSLMGQNARFTTKEFGLVCSAIPTYLREKEQEINRRKRFTDDKDSQYVGEVGKRGDFLNLTLVFAREFTSDWEVSHMYKFKDEKGNVIIWWSSNVFWNAEKQEDISVGDVVNLTATVKRHEEREGVKQTSITRAVTYKSKEQKKAEAKARKEERANAQATIA